MKQNFKCLDSRFNKIYPVIDISCDENGDVDGIGFLADDDTGIYRDEQMLEHDGIIIYAGLDIILNSISQLSSEDLFKIKKDVDSKLARNDVIENHNYIKTLNVKGITVDDIIVHAYKDDYYDAYMYSFLVRHDNTLNTMYYGCKEFEDVDEYGNSINNLFDFIPTEFSSLSENIYECNFDLDKAMIILNECGIRKIIVNDYEDFSSLICNTIEKYIELYGKEYSDIIFDCIINICMQPVDTYKGDGIIDMCIKNIIRDFKNGQPNSKL